ncbi:hypothetical protein ACFY8A_33360, partial [Streptomyces sp. NPDC012746]
MRNAAPIARLLLLLLLSLTELALAAWYMWIQFMGDELSEAVDMIGRPVDEQLAHVAAQPSTLPFLGLSGVFALMLMVSPELREFLRELVRRRREWRGGVLSFLIVALALIAGRKRCHLQAEWTDHLRGTPDDDEALSPSQRIWAAAGFVKAAARMRLHDMTRLLWRPVDWTLLTDNRTNSLISLGVGALAVYIQATDGLHALLTNGWEPCGILGGG